MNMTHTILMRDEKKEGEYIYQNGFGRDLNWRDVYLLAKYLHIEKGLGSSRLYPVISEMCKRDVHAYNDIINRKVMKAKIRHAIKKGYIRDLPVIITRKELDAIWEMKNFHMQKILLAVLFISKKKDSENFCVYYMDKQTHKFYSDAELVREMLDNRRFSANRIRSDILSMLDGEFLKTRYAGFIQPAFMDNDTSDESAVFRISDNQQAKNLIPDYVKLIGGDIRFCKSCGNSYPKKDTNHSLYCKDCSEKKQKEKYYRYNKKRDTTVRV